MNKIKAALFDLDGVILDTEGQYTDFWDKEGKKFLNKKDLGKIIKGMSLSSILKDYFGNEQKVCDIIKKDLALFEATMDLPFIPGVKDFIDELTFHGIKKAVVTSSNALKMESVYKKIPEFKNYFDKIFTAEDYTQGKPSPDCYLKGAAYFNTSQDETLVFEDSVNGLISGRDSGMILIGLTTTNPFETVKKYTPYIINSFDGISLKKLNELFKI